MARRRVGLTGALVLLAVGIGLMGVANTVEVLGTRAGLYGLVLILAGLLTAFRLQ